MARRSCALASSSPGFFSLTRQFRTTKGTSTMNETTGRNRRKRGCKTEAVHDRVDEKSERRSFLVSLLSPRKLREARELCLNRARFWKTARRSAEPRRSSRSVGVFRRPFCMRLQLINVHRLLRSPLLVWVLAHCHLFLDLNKLHALYYGQDSGIFLQCLPASAHEWQHSFTVLRNARPTQLMSGGRRLFLDGPLPECIVTPISVVTGDIKMYS